jgi:Fic family protein
VSFCNQTVSHAREKKSDEKWKPRANQHDHSAHKFVNFEPINSIIRLMYNWQIPDWPHFQYDIAALEAKLLLYSEQLGKMNGMLQGVNAKDRTDMMLSGLIAEAMKTSEIEGEYVSRKDVMSSIRNQLGMNDRPESVSDLRAQGVSELMVSARDTFAQPLSEEMLFDWHSKLMKGSVKVNAGKWRHHSEPMQVVSGTVGKETVHFEAPSSSAVPHQMRAFIQWFNSTAPTGSSPIHQAPVRSAIAHLYFESIHPFEDGNGRIGRVISEKVLAQHANGWLPISISRPIVAERKQYYHSLKAAQGTLVITEWLSYFIAMLLDAMHHMENQIGFVLRKTQFFGAHGDQMNARQLKVVRRMLDEGPDDFEGGMNARKYISLTGASKATATRDLQDLLDKGILSAFGGGRSRAYQVNC